MQGVEPCCAVADDPRCRGSAAPWISHGHAPAMSSPIGSRNPNRDRVPGPGDISARSAWRIIHEFRAYSLPRTLSRALAEQSRMSTHVPTGIRISDRSNALSSLRSPHRDRADLAISFLSGPSHSALAAVCRSGRGYRRFSADNGRIAPGKGLSNGIRKCVA